MQRSVSPVRTKADLDWKKRAVLSLPLQFQASSHGARFWMTRVRSTMLSVASAHRSRDEVFHIEAQKLATAIAKHPVGSFIEQSDLTFWIYFQDGVRRRLQELAEPALKAAFLPCCSLRVLFWILGCHVGTDLVFNSSTRSYNKSIRYAVPAVAGLPLQSDFTLCGMRWIFIAETKAKEFSQLPNPFVKGNHFPASNCVAECSGSSGRNSAGSYCDLTASIRSQRS